MVLLEAVPRATATIVDLMALEMQTLASVALVTDGLVRDQGGSASCGSQRVVSRCHPSSITQTRARGDWWIGLYRTFSSGR